MVLLSLTEETKQKAEEYAVREVARQYETSEKTARQTVERLLQKEWLCAADEDTVKGVLVYDCEERRVLFLAGDDISRTALLDRLKDLFAEECAARILVRAQQKDRYFYESYGFECCGEQMNDLHEMEYLLGRELIGKTVHVIVDHPLGSMHPTLAVYYPVNAGYAILNEETADSYVIGPNEPLDAFTGTVCGIIYRRNSDRIRLIVCRTGEIPDKEKIIQAVGFEEQYFETRILWN